MMESEKTRKSMRTFYDEFGWTRDPESGELKAVVCHEDLDGTTQRYMDANEARYIDVFKEGGDFFLDAGCGGEPRPHFSKGFAHHVCLDLSHEGLLRAKEQLTDRAHYVQADMARLPFKEGAFGGILACHCLYHVDRDEQPLVIREFVRILDRNKHAVVFYSTRWNLISFHQKIVNTFKKLIARFKPAPNGALTEESADTPPPLYFRQVPLRDLLGENTKAHVSCLRILTKSETAFLRKIHLFSPLLPAVLLMERAFPKSMTYVGPYVAIDIRKEA
jgi:SAM-dependent methyltransferase